MYDRLEITKPAVCPVKNPRTDRHWLRRNRLHLFAAQDTSSPLLGHAISAATSLGYVTEALPNGSVVILDLDLETALLLVRRFPTLLARYEPARTF